MKTVMSILINTLIFVVIIPTSVAGDLTIPNEFTGGTKAVASEVNSNFNAVAAEVNDNNVRLEAVETQTGNNDNRIIDNVSDITSLGGRVTTNENDMSAMEGRVTANESNMAAVAGRVTANESDVTVVEGRVTTLENDMTSIDFDRTTCGGLVIPPFTPPPCAITLTTTHVTIASVAFVAPATGYVVVSADGYYSFAHTTGIASSVCIGITSSSAGTPCGGGIIIGPITVSQRRAAVPASSPGGTYQSGMHSQIVYSVTAGTNYTFYLRGLSSSATTTFNKYGLIAYFVPNRM